MSTHASFVPHTSANTRTCMSAFFAPGSYLAKCCKIVRILSDSLGLKILFFWTVSNFLYPCMAWKSIWMGLWVREYGLWYYPKYSKYMQTRNLSYIKNPYCPYMFFFDRPYTSKYRKLKLWQHVPPRVHPKSKTIVKGLVGWMLSWSLAKRLFCSGVELSRGGSATNRATLSSLIYTIHHDLDFYQYIYIYILPLSTLCSSVREGGREACTHTATCIMCKITAYSLHFTVDSI